MTITGSRSVADGAPIGRVADHRARRLAWGAIAARGGAALAVGVATLLLPALPGALLLALLAGYALVSAGTALGAARHLAQHGLHVSLLTGYALAGTLMAGLLLWSPGRMHAAVGAMFAAWLMVASVAELAAASRMGRLFPHGWLIGAIGGAGLLASAALIVLPEWLSWRIERTIGAYALVSSAFLFGLAYRVWRPEHRLLVHHDG